MPGDPPSCVCVPCVCVPVATPGWGVRGGDVVDDLEAYKERLELEIRQLEGRIRRMREEAGQT